MSRSLGRSLGPGLLLAATGVGAGDLATGAITGSKVGLAVLWAVVVGAAMKWFLTEGLARFQLATGQTLLEGALLRVGRRARWLFLLYLLPWSFFVGSALVSACGVALHAAIPVFDDASTGKVVFGVASSLGGWALVRASGFARFELLMRVLVGAMFATTVATAALLVDDWGEVLAGLCVPRIPSAGEGDPVGWTVALMGGVGGTLTVLCYGYWLRETGRDRPDQLGLCRLDLAVGYAVTALFGIAMVVIGSGIEVEGSGAGLLVDLGDRLGLALGPAARAIFLAGACAAVLSSLLGVWQAVPYLFADFCQVAAGRAGPVDTKGRAYRGFLAALATVPLCGLFFRFVAVQKVYAVVGAMFMPLLALALLWLNGRAAIVGARFRNRWWQSALLAAVAVFFVLVWD
jgi:Mn2+/Fe2+ NRAMP family transporter